MTTIDFDAKFNKEQFLKNPSFKMATHRHHQWLGEVDWQCS